MRILTLTWKHPEDPTAGGAERYLVEVCRRWADAGHEVTIFGPRSAASAGLSGAISLSSTNLRYIGQGSRLTVFRAARRYLRAHGNDYDGVLETVSTRPFAAHRVVGERAVALYHQTAEEVWNLEFPWPVALLGRHLLEPMWVRQMRTARVVANSSSTAAALGRFGVRCWAAVPPGCDLPRCVRERSSPSPEPKLLWIGRLVRTKRPQDAILALAEVRAKFPSATLDMVGGGYLQVPLAAAAGPGVTVHGQITEAAKRHLLKQADLLLLPGTREGWGIVAMEAAAFGVPTVAYDIPGLRDAVVDGVTGLLAPPDPLSLGAAACRVLSDPDLWSRVALAARRRAPDYSWDRCAQALLDFLVAGCASRSGGTADPLPTGAGEPPKAFSMSMWDQRCGSVIGAKCRRPFVERSLLVQNAGRGGSCLTTRVTTDYSEQLRDRRFHPSLGWLSSRAAGSVRPCT